MTSPGIGNNKAMTILAITTRDTHTDVPMCLEITVKATAAAAGKIN